MSELSGLSVLVTRPEHQAEPLCQAIQAYGGRVLRLPAIAIAPPRHPERLRALLTRLDEFDLAIFISANAVDNAMRYLHETDRNLAGLKIAAVGKATARALQRHGQAVAIVPVGSYNSEALLQHPELQHLDGSRVVIFRGEGGREHLADNLTARGAQVEYAECYRRAKPAADTGPVLEAWAQDRLDVVIVTSNEALTNLFEMLGTTGQHYLQNTPIIGVSERMHEPASRLGLRGPLRIAQNASDDALITSLREWAAALSR